MGKKKHKKSPTSTLSLGGENQTHDIAYLLRIIEEPHEPPIGITQEDFDFILDYGTTLPSRELSQDGEYRDFATLEAVEGKKFYHHGEIVKKKFVNEFFGRAMSAFIHNYVQKVKQEMNVLEDESNEVDPLVQYVADALFEAWFPHGHNGGPEDLENWQNCAVEDAKVAVKAIKTFHSDALK